MNPSAPLSGRLLFARKSRPEIRRIFPFSDAPDAQPVPSRKSPTSSRMPIRLVAAFLLFATLARAGVPSPAGVVVLANAAEPESLALARHYLKARSIPEKNLIALPLPTEERDHLRTSSSPRSEPAP